MTKKFWRITLEELHAGAIPTVETQPERAEYFHKEKLLLEHHGCEEFFMATRRHAADCRRCGSGDTTNIVEGRQTWLTQKIAEFSAGRPELSEVQ